MHVISWQVAAWLVAACSAGIESVSIRQTDPCIRRGHTTLPTYPIPKENAVPAEVKHQWRETLAMYRNEGTPHSPNLPYSIHRKMLLLLLRN